jgi:multidrug efflux pump subunit AcrB
MVEQGKPFAEAALEAAKLRFRPIMMTSIAFMLGVIPLVISTGPGSVARHSISTAALGGMFVATTAGILVVPLFFVLLGRFDRRLNKLASSTDNCQDETDASSSQQEQERGELT